MRIAILSYSFPPKLGGGEIVLSALASHLADHKNDLFVISNANGPMSRNYNLYRTPSFPSDRVSRLLHLIVGPFLLLCIALVHDVEVIQAAGILDLLVAFPAKIIFRCPVVLRLASWYHPILVGKLRILVSLISNTIVVLNSSMKDELSALFASKRIVIITNGVDVNKFRPSSTKRDKVVLLWVGRLDENKRPDLAIEALRLGRSRFDNIYLKIIGVGSLEAYLRDLATKYRLNDSIDFLSYQTHNQVAKVMRNADIFLMTSKGEGMSNALLEAMSCGLVIIASSASCTDVIRNNFNGLIAETPQEFFSAIVKLVANPVLKKKMADNARKTVVERFSFNQTISRYLQIYKELVRKRNAVT